jgi:Arc/MetJ-type ribon-helix-helix transcriptional regulator
MNYAFPADLQQLVREELATGKYPTEDELLMAAVQLLRDQDKHLEEIKAELNRRIAGLDRGGGIELEDDDALKLFFQDIETRGRARYEASKIGQ